MLQHARPDIRARTQTNGTPSVFQELPRRRPRAPLNRVVRLLQPLLEARRRFSPDIPSFVLWCVSEAFGHDILRAHHAHDWQEDPNFHKYLRSEVEFTASQAVLGEPSEAAQFQITGGQLIQNANGTPLYAVVEAPADSTVKKLAVSWSASPSTSGTFVFSGDTVEWSSPNITRPQNNVGNSFSSFRIQLTSNLKAWLVCPDADGNLDLYVNLGAYAYQTPAGCADETIHAYTGSTATA